MYLKIIAVILVPLLITELAYPSYFKRLCHSDCVIIPTLSLSGLTGQSNPFDFIRFLDSRFRGNDIKEQNLRPHMSFSNSAKSTQSVSSPKKISDVEVIESSPTKIGAKANIKNFVEEPLLVACEIFYEKNIETLSSSANKKDLTFSILNDEEYYAYIIISYDTLSSLNRKVIDRIIEKNNGYYGDIKIKMINYGGRAVDFLIPITQQSTVKEVSDKAIGITNIFTKQKMTWALTYTLDYFQSKGGSIEELDDYGGYYDRENKVVYISKEHYDKVEDLKGNSLSIRAKLSPLQREVNAGL